MSTLDDLITNANNVLGALEGLIQGDAAETPLPDTSVSYNIPAIAYDPNNTAWTLSQTAADSSDGLYKGLFTLALETGCSYVTVVSHNVVTPDDGVPARYEACGGSTLVDVSSMTALNNLQINKLEIRSKQPFSVSIRLLQSWCYEFDFTQSNGGWTAVVGNNLARGTWVAGSGWRAVCGQTNPGSYSTIVHLTKSMPGSAAVTRIEIDYDFQLGTISTQSRVVLQADGVTLINQTTNPANGANTAVWTGSRTIASSIAFFIQPAATGNTNFCPSGSATAKHLRVYGTGADPFGAANCP